MAEESPAVILFDIEGNEVRVALDGNARIVETTDQSSRDLLEQILVELRRMNSMLAYITEADGVE